MTAGAGDGPGASDGPPEGIDRSIPGELSQLYQEVILDHYRRPRNKEEMDAATHTVTRNNPLCGDVISLNLRVEGGVIRQATYEGRGCSISQAAASMLTEGLAGRPVGEAQQIADKFTRMMHGEEELTDDEQLGDLRALVGVSRFPVRIKCALLGFDCLEELVGDGDAGDGREGRPGGG